MSIDLFGAEVPEARSLSSHETSTSGTDEWLTPPDLIAALGSFDLDPCSPGRRRPWDTAAKHYGIEDDGLRQEWRGRVWLNPPYSTASRWMHRLAEHGTGTALLFARTETRLWFDHIWPRATGLLFLRGRLRFCYVTGKPADAAGAPSVLIAYGKRDAEVLASQPWPGAYSWRSPPRPTPAARRPPRSGGGGTKPIAAGPPRRPSQKRTHNSTH